VIKYFCELELDQDGETILGVISNPDTKIPICVYVGDTIDEVRQEINEYLGETFWDFDSEIHIQERLRS
jgi:hypothetical protein